MGKPLLSAIWAQSETGVIGKGNQLPWHAPKDLKHFKATTLGKPIIMGRSTFESIGRPLPGRLNIVLSSTFSSTLASSRTGDLMVVRNLDAALAVGAGLQVEEIVVIGGAKVYAAAIPLCQRIYRTVVSSTSPIEGDVVLPQSAPSLRLPRCNAEVQVGTPSPWCLQNEGERVQEGRFGLRFQLLERRQ